MFVLPRGAAELTLTIEPWYTLTLAVGPRSEKDITQVSGT